MPADFGVLIEDLAAETAALRTIIDPLADADWQLPTPAPGWTIADQVSHLAYFDEAAVTSATDPDAFRAEFARLTDGGADADMIAAELRHLNRVQLHDWFGRARSQLLSVFGNLDPAARVPWFGPPMSVASAVTARLMETWAHGQDIADTVGARREPTHRLRHVAHIGVGARAFSYVAHGLPVPAEPVRVELVAPSGELWTWGPAGAADVVTGPALDFCLLVTQRRHRADTAVVAQGPVGQQWLTIAQAFAGPPGSGRVPGQFAASTVPGRHESN
ncbi:MAG TPA: TIGR03084 family metal-binding protein [Streptosporangiaceae bacterium]|nr:TIGR03084 family metal-binding protein [Streptosporangiaceae bacterium]